MMKQLRSLLLFLLIFPLCLELVTRLTSYEEDSRIYLYGVFPIGLAPTEEVWQSRFEELAEVEDKALHYATYDSILGWGYRHNYTSKDSLYVFNEYGMRAHPESLPNCQHEDNCLKILLAGNSYMMSAEVAGHESLAYFLEKFFWDQDIPCHVYNGAAGNYSIDQAYLQWQKQGYIFQPDIIVLGINPQHYTNNLSTFPYSYYPETHIYYSKPQAIIQGDSLKWLNLPTVPAEQLLQKMVVDFDGSELATHEYEQKLPRLRKESQWPKPYLWSIITRYAMNIAPPTPESKARVQEVSHALAREFEREAQEKGSRLILLQTPVFEDIIGGFTGIPLLSQEAPYAIDSIAPTVYTEDVLLEFPLITQGFTPSLSHYSVEGNRRIAQKLGEFLQDSITHQNLPSYNQSSVELKKQGSCK